MLIRELRRGFEAFDLDQVVSAADVDESTANQAARQVFQMQCARAVEDGVVTKKERASLKRLGDRLRISSTVQDEILTSAAETAYEEEVDWAMRDGQITAEEAEDLRGLRENMGLPPVDLYSFSQPASKRTRSSQSASSSEDQSEQDPNEADLAKENEARHQRLIGPTKSEQSNRRLLIFFGTTIAVILVGLTSIGIGVRDVMFASATQSWPQIDAEVTKVELVTYYHHNQGMDDNTHDHRIHYRFTLNGEEYSGKQLREGIHNWASGLKSITVYYSPNDPSQSVVTRGYGKYGSNGWYDLIPGMLAVFLPAFLLTAGSWQSPIIGAWGEQIRQKCIAYPDMLPWLTGFGFFFCGSMGLALGYFLGVLLSSVGPEFQDNALKRARHR